MIFDRTLSGGDEKRNIMQEQQSNGTCTTPVLIEPVVSDELTEAWREVGRQFQQLGNRLAITVRRSLVSRGSRERSTETLSNLRDDFRATADRIDHVIHEVSEATEEDRTETLRATRRASEQSLEEARILTAATLRKLNRQLDHLVKRLDEEERRGG
jgi:hypothetical protein